MDTSSSGAGYKVRGNTRQKNAGLRRTYDMDGRRQILHLYTVYIQYVYVLSCHLIWGILDLVTHHVSVEGMLLGNVTLTD